jgi:hypothetical protein
MQTGQTGYGGNGVLPPPALRKDGATISVEFTMYPAKQDGSMIGVAAVMRDVTKRFNEMCSLTRKLKEAAKAAG